ncbi:FmdB family transcriptional regulator [Agromyces badenianii]|uniref:FmdB family transcriptional regulator n=1 Tax=Agromyces badenianii TaxID=2080742 RepID=A0A2S0WU31_9MICO|nr:FmdB family zinc ribbon protein [Agromyces badenianii]AWB94798.1 FmdB family transcriptional regulator [Agromyces badenianii]
MPTYSYRCTECDNAFDIHQAFTDDTLTVCEVCGGKLRKLFNTIGVTFNGSGFYRTDSRGGSPESKKSSDSGSSSGSSSSGSSSSGSSSSGSSSSGSSSTGSSKSSGSGSSGGGSSAGGSSSASVA